MAENLEVRVAALEAEVAELREILGQRKGKIGWRKMVGAFLNDPYYEKAMKYGREYRESFRPKSSISARNRRKKEGHS